MSTSYGQPNYQAFTYTYQPPNYFNPVPQNNFGAGYNPPANLQVALARQSNPIGEEGYKLLRSKGGGDCNFVVSRETFFKKLCTHRHNNNFSLQKTGDDTFKCTICQTSFNGSDTFDPKTLQACVDYIEESWEWAKIRNLNTMSPAILQDFAKTMCMLELYPNAYKKINENFVANDVGGSAFVQSQTATLNQQQAYNMMNMPSGYQYAPVYQTMNQSQVVGNPFAGAGVVPPPMPYAPAPVYQTPPPPPQQYYPPQQQPYQAVPQQPYPYPPQQPAYPPQQQPGYQAPPQQYYPPPAAAGTVVPPMAPPPPPVQPAQVDPPQNPTQQTTPQPVQQPQQGQPAGQPTKVFKN